MSIRWRGVGVGASGCGDCAQLWPPPPRRCSCGGVRAQSALSIATGRTHFASTDWDRYNTPHTGKMAPLSKQSRLANVFFSPPSSSCCPKQIKGVQTLRSVRRDNSCYLHGQLFWSSPCNVRSLTN